MLAHVSIGEIHEDDLVRRLMKDRYWRSSVIGLNGIPHDAVDKQCVKLEGVPNKGRDKGDIDILLCAPNRPDRAVAIQVKMVKVRARAFSGGNPNGLGNLKEGVCQANLLAGIGFAQVYLYVFIVVDSREQNSEEASYAGAPAEFKNLIERCVSATGLDLDPRVGLLQYEFVQPTDDPPLGAGGSVATLVRLAQEGVQTGELTEWVGRVMGFRFWAARRHAE